MKRTEVEKALAMMSVVRQCGLLELSRSTFYYRPVGEAAYNLGLMRLIDEQFTKRPFYGVPRMTACLRAMGYGDERQALFRPPLPQSRMLPKSLQLVERRLSDDFGRNGCVQAGVDKALSHHVSPRPHSALQRS